MHELRIAMSLETFSGYLHVLFQNGPATPLRPAVQRVDAVVKDVGFVVEVVADEGVVHLAMARRSRRTGPDPGRGPHEVPRSSSHSHRSFSLFQVLTSTFSLWAYP